MRGSVPAAWGVPALAPARSRSWNTTPPSEAGVTVTVWVPVLLLPGMSTAPITAGAVSSTAVLVPALPPDGMLVKRAGTVTVATPSAFSRPMVQVTVRPLTLQVPLAVPVPAPPPAGATRVQVTGPVTSAPCGSVSVRLVARLSPGPPLRTVTVQVMGWWMVATAVLPVLVTVRFTRWRSVVGSLALSLVLLLSGSLALAVAWLRNTSPVGAGWFKASKRRKIAFDCPAASSPRARPVVLVPAGTSQVKVASGVPDPEVRLFAEHSDGLLQVLPPKVVVSQTKRTACPAGGVITSVILTPVPNDGPVLLTSTRYCMKVPSLGPGPGA